MTAQWTEAHRREALRRSYEIAAELASAGLTSSAAELVYEPLVESEAWWRRDLAGSACFDAARIGREVRRVRGLAEGRLVRETWWRARDGSDGLLGIWPGDDYGRSSARAFVRARVGRRLVRVTRIRKAVRT